MRLRNRIHDLCRGRRDHVTKLIRDARETGAECRGGKFVEVDGDHAPGALHEELDHEARGGEAAFGGGEDPGGDEAGGYQGGADDGAAAAEPLREVAD